MRELELRQELVLVRRRLVPNHNHLVEAHRLLDAQQVGQPARGSVRRPTAFSDGDDRVARRRGVARVLRELVLLFLKSIRFLLSDLRGVQLVLQFVVSRGRSEVFLSVLGRVYPSEVVSEFGPLR